MEHRKEALGLARHETFVPQSYDWGVEARVNWYEAYADLDGERVELQVFSLRSITSGAAYQRAYLRATQQAFLEAYELAFQYFGGVFRPSSGISPRGIRFYVRPTYLTLCARALCCYHDRKRPQDDIGHW